MRKKHAGGQLSRRELPRGLFRPRERGRTESSPKFIRLAFYQSAPSSKQPSPATSTLFSPSRAPCYWNWASRPTHRNRPASHSPHDDGAVSSQPSSYGSISSQPSPDGLSTIWRPWFNNDAHVPASPCPSQPLSQYKASSGRAGSFSDGNGTRPSRS